MDFDFRGVGAPLMTGAPKYVRNTGQVSCYASICLRSGAFYTCDRDRGPCREHTLPILGNHLLISPGSNRTTSIHVSCYPRLSL